MTIDNFASQLERYAKLLIDVGVNIQTGQRLLIGATLESRALVHQLSEQAYKAGASLVDVLWEDEMLNLIRFEHATKDSFQTISTWSTDEKKRAVERGDALLNIRGNNPSLLKNQDADLISQSMKAQRAYAKPVSAAISKNTIPWCVAAASVPAWAQLIFPDKSEQVAVDSLWEAIFTTTRLNAEDPVQAWRKHIRDLEKRAAYLTSKQYQALEYQAEGTNLRLGLADNHVWRGGGSTTLQGISFAPNMPTEEVFCAPHKDKVDGVVQSSKPLSYGGQIIEDFSLEFKAGRVVSVTARYHQAILERLISTDEGASRLGEVALVPHSSPISQTGLLFYNTLFDENAACHLALGEAYKDCVVGGTTMSAEDFKSHGGNMSMTHVDFMVGSNALDIDGVHQDGSKEAVMRAGEWAFDVIAPD